MVTSEVGRGEQAENESSRSSQDMPGQEPGAAKMGTGEEELDDVEADMDEDLEVEDEEEEVSGDEEAAVDSEEDDEREDPLGTSDGERG